MLRLINLRPKPLTLSLLHLPCVHVLSNRSARSPASLVGGVQPLPGRLHSSFCTVESSVRGGAAAAASIWHSILPVREEGCNRTVPTSFLNEQKGEGSWNVAWDVRPFRWLRHSDYSWFLFGICSCPYVQYFGINDENPEIPVIPEIPVACSETNIQVSTEDVVVSPAHPIQVSAQDSVVSPDHVEISPGQVEISPGQVENPADPPSYKVYRVMPDGRCLFRSLVYLNCLRSGEEPPDEDGERELADKLRLQVAEELIRRRQESEWFIEDNFDAYVKNIQQPATWGGEPELIMACHVLKTSISIFANCKVTGKFMKIADYGEEYSNNDEKPMNLMYHWFGHYDALEGDVSQYTDNT